MNYWSGYMNWPLNNDWVCETCGSRSGLTWGLVHAQCRCCQCHTQYTMRDSDSNVVDTPICRFKDEYKAPARKAWAKYGVPVDELTDEIWDEFMEKEINE